MIFSLLLRYSLLHSEYSSIKLTKVNCDGEISAGLECTKHIPASTYILTAGGSMSSDNYGVNVGGLSVVIRGARQLGPENERLLLGPLRFVNHGCMPNCQVSIPHFIILHH
jgi:hypothetical protein